MIRKLQIKFIVIILSIMTLTLVCIFGVINLIMYNSTEKQTMDMMTELASNDGQMGKRGQQKDIGFVTESKKIFMQTEDEIHTNKEPPPFPQANFSIKLSEQEAVLEIIADKSGHYTEEDIRQYLERVLLTGKQSGSIEALKYLREDKAYGQIIVFVDNSIQKSAEIRLLLITSGVGIISLIVIFFIALYLSRWAIRPVKEAYEVQKRFVADASHELKTPLTVILTNADVLESDIGETKWLSFIKAEAIRMKGLVDKLLYLAKSDASDNRYDMQVFDMSDAVLSTVLPYESSCYEQQKQLVLEVEENLLYKGDKNGLMQVVIILLDNAIKHASVKGEIRITLTRENNKLLCSVYNTGEGITDEEKQKIFDRFYRGDSSRARETGGYGLGLSIAKTIVDAHKGKILIESEAGKFVRFTVVLS